MKLIAIDKQVYRQHLSRVISIFIASLAILSLLFGQLLIHFFGNTEIVSGESTGNLPLNFLGVLLGFTISALTVYRLRHRDYFKEIYYVSRLKVLHNRIYRKLTSIKSAAEQDNINALIILNFYYTSLKLVYQLDDNTLTLSHVESELAAIQQKLTALGLTVNEQDFSQELLASF
ncbi:DUF3087 family protein [Shewanella sp. Isolate11]|uniref:DUF3087 family protein n=1 Tax=Shewanella sp. Isolate11 TaxID=2908530 RepID=UPI001EFE24D7|nr:DUF3087 family protein [Shewanella sp. Isolate11]MCG9695653.1 DUF3087 domain-containing protein [Shewanella sp. Isolate11]